MKLRLAFAMDPNKTRYVVDDETMTRLSSTCAVISAEPLREFSSAQARDVLARVDVLVTGWGCPFISSDVLNAAPYLRLVAHAAGTVKSLIDPVAYERGIIVTHAADANAVPVAEFTLAAIIFANKRVWHFADLYDEDRARRSSYAMMDEPIGNYRRVIGIVGASRIGRRVIAALQALECSVLLYDPFVPADDPLTAQVELVELNALMARSDVVSIHAPSLPATRGMIGSHQFKLMRDGATFINTARGAIVDEAALITELKTGRISAVIDVTDPEIPDADSALHSLPNVVLTPHIAGAVGLERSRLGRLVAEEIDRFAQGLPLQYAIEPQLLERLA